MDCLSTSLKAKLFLGFGEGVHTDSIQVPINANPKRVIFVHRLLESRIPEGEPIAKLIADYVFHYTDGEVVSVPIRERFEIGSVPQGWGQQTFLAIPTGKTAYTSVTKGHGDPAGNRQTEATQGTPRDYYLWAWKNPREGAEVASIEIQPQERRFIVAAITLGYLDEIRYPAVRVVKSKSRSLNLMTLTNL